MSLADTRISCFRGGYDPTPTAHGSLAQVLTTIGSDAYESQITKLRYTLHRQGKGLYDHYKKLLNAATFGGTFSPTRGKETLLQHSGLVHLDYDHVCDLAHVREVLCGAPTVAYVFVSPSGHGLKVGVHVAQVADDASYKHAWQVVSDHVASQYGLEADPTGKDISRLCFMAWDPDAYVHLDAEVFVVPPLVVPPPPTPATRHTSTSPTGDRRDTYLQQAIARAIKLIENSRPPTNGTPGTRHRNRLRAAMLLGGYVAGGFLSYDEAYAILADVVRANTLHFERSMRTIAGGLRYGERTPVTYEDLEQERLAWCAANGYTPAQRSRP
jgi:hypothetical protein